MFGSSHERHQDFHNSNARPSEVPSSTSAPPFQSTSNGLMEPKESQLHVPPKLQLTDRSTKKSCPEQHCQTSSLSRIRLKDDKTIWTPMGETNKISVPLVPTNDRLHARYQPPVTSTITKSIQEPFREPVIKSTRQVIQEPGRVQQKNNLGVPIIPEAVHFDPQTRLRPTDNSYRLPLQQQHHHSPALHPYHPKSTATDMTLKLPRHHPFQPPITFHQGVLQPTPLRPNVNPCHGHINRPDTVVPPISPAENKEQYSAAKKHLAYLQGLTKLQMKTQCGHRNFQSHQGPASLDLQTRCGSDGTVASKSLASSHHNNARGETKSIPGHNFLKDGGYWMTAGAFNTPWNVSYKHQPIDDPGKGKSQELGITGQTLQAPLDFKHCHRSQPHSEQQIKELKVSQSTNSKESMELLRDKFPPVIYSASATSHVKNSDLSINRPLPPFLPHTKMGFIPHSSMNF